MTHPHDLSPTPLARRALWSLEGGQGKAVGVFSGRIWITEERMPDDHVLGPGDSMALRRPGLVLIEGLEDSQVILFDSDPSTVRPQPAAAAQNPAPGTAVERSRGGRPGLAGRGGPSLMDYERLAYEMRRQARADALRWLFEALGRLLRLLVPRASPPAAAPRPGVGLARRAPC